MEQYSAESIWVQSESRGLLPAPQKLIDQMILAQESGNITPPQEGDKRQIKAGDIILQTSTGLNLVSPGQFGKTHADILAILEKNTN